MARWSATTTSPSCHTSPSAVATSACSRSQRADRALTRSAEALRQIGELVAERRGQARAERPVVLLDLWELLAPTGSIDRDELRHRGVVDVEAAGVDRVRGGDDPDLGVDALTGAVDALDDPLEHP